MGFLVQRFYNPAYLPLQGTHESYYTVPAKPKYPQYTVLALAFNYSIIAYMHKVIVIVGTNASGKSSLAVELAKKFNGEVISADSRQVYKGLDVATGKVTQEEMGGVPHHLIDIADPAERYTAANFAEDGRKALDDIIARGKLPIIAGGTGFYIDALLNPKSLAAVPPNERLRLELGKSPIEDLFEQLKEIDPNRAADLAHKGEQNLKRRIVRAIEVALTAPEHHEEIPKNEPLDALWIGTRWDDDTLKERIHTRTIQRIESGMVEEAQQLHADGLSWERMEELGLEYKHLADYLRDKISKEELVELINRDDWRYAKRQRTWFKRNEEINWFDGSELNEAGELVREFLK